MFNLLIGLFINLPVAIFCGVVGITRLGDAPVSCGFIFVTLYSFCSIKYSCF